MTVSTDTHIAAAQTVSDLQSKATIDYRHELVRKAIHMCSLSIPTIYYFISREVALLILAPMALAFLVTDLSRYYVPPISRWFYRWFGWLLRKHEQDDSKKRLNGATNVLIAAFITVAVFPKVIAITAFAILIVSDSTSALLGRRFGKHRFFAKSLEGSTAFFVSAILVVAVAPKLLHLQMEYIIGILAGAVGAVVEALPIRIDDNLSIPISVGFTMWGLYLLLLPALNLFALQ